MAIETSIDSSNAAVPPRIRTRRISSVAYADEEIASELKIASAFFLLSRSSISASLARGRPKTMRASTCERTPGRGARERRGFSRDELAGSGVSEIRRVGTLDPDALVARLAPGQRTTTTDHRRAVLRATGRRALGDADRRRSARACGTSIRCHAGRPAWPSRRARHRSTIAQHSPRPGRPAAVSGPCRCPSRPRRSNAPRRRAGAR